MDYKKAAGFQQHMKKAEAMSHFSKSKTMVEQREFLPIFQVKEDLLRVIRDNQVGIKKLKARFVFAFCFLTTDICRDTRPMAGGGGVGGRCSKLDLCVVSDVDRDVDRKQRDTWQQASLVFCVVPFPGGHRCLLP